MAAVQPSYLFYDIETTGLNKCFDQVIQFAAIRTDLELNEIERSEIQVKLNPDVIPTPGAIITHRIGIQEMLTGENENVAARKIHDLLNRPGTISLGYNTLGFDDEFLRFTFYRNLLPPYTHQYASQCSRMDIYPIAVMYHLYKPEILTWPIIDNKISLKLENINQANQLASGQAHNAMVDVEVTLALARKLKQNTEMWAFVTGYFNKPTDLERMRKLPYTLKMSECEYQEGLMISGKFGAANQYQAPVISLGQHQHYRNQTLWLRLDSEMLSQTNNGNISENTFVIRKRAAEQQIILPPSERFLKKLSKKRLELMQKNRQFLLQNQALLKQICEHHQNFKYPAVPNVDAQAALYELDFPPAYEEKLYRRFQTAKPQEKEAIALDFADHTRRELALRVLARHYPKYLSNENKRPYQAYCQAIASENNAPNDFRSQKPITVNQALAEVKTLRDQKHCDPQQQTLLNDLQVYLQRNDVLI